MPTYVAYIYTYAPQSRHGRNTLCRKVIGWNLVTAANHLEANDYLLQTHFPQPFRITDASAKHHMPKRSQGPDIIIPRSFPP